MKDEVVRIALAQVNPTVGDIEGNAARVRTRVREAREAGADIVAFPEMALTGYPPEDLLLKPAFLRRNVEALEALAREIGEIVAVVGFVEADEDLHNAAAVLYDGRVVGIHRKHYLPNYSVFDEERYFDPGRAVTVFETAGGARFGVTVCEDMWYPAGPGLAQAVAGGAELLINISASPYHRGKGLSRERMFSTRALETGAAVAFVNQVGGQDELVFDGHSLVFDGQGRLLARAPQFREALLVADVDLGAIAHAQLRDPRRRKDAARALAAEVGVVRLDHGRIGAGRPSEPAPVAPLLDELDEVHAALVLATGDYVRKNGFERVAVGLSGGIDSALTAAIAVEALGAANVVGVTMPSMYSSPGSVSDSEVLARSLGIALHRIPIAALYKAYEEALAEAFRGTEPGVAEENLQSRIRGNLLMALSNKFGWMVLTTGNKSEMSVGYATLYGDMAGGFAVIKDVPKTLVYRLAERLNERAGRELIPHSTIAKPPSAELRPDQRDTDSLPPYEVLDPILEAYIEEDRAPREIAAMGFDADVVARVVRLVDVAEYKRRQSPPGVRISQRAFGKDRRVPITNRFRP